MADDMWVGFPFSCIDEDCGTPFPRLISAEWSSHGGQRLNLECLVCAKEFTWTATPDMVKGAHEQAMQMLVSSMLEELGDDLGEFGIEFDGEEDDAPTEEEE